MGDSVEETPKKTRDVAVVGTIGHMSPSMRTSLLLAALSVHSQYVTKELEEKDIPQLKSPRTSPLVELDISPYPNYRQSKGEKKKQRAFNRRFYGRDWV